MPVWSWPAEDSDEAVAADGTATSASHSTLICSRSEGGESVGGLKLAGDGDRDHDRVGAVIEVLVVVVVSRLPDVDRVDLDESRTSSVMAPAPSTCKSSTSEDSE
jgi:hypothetical protein